MGDFMIPNEGSKRDGTGLSPEKYGDSCIETMI
jgi:hypothetical protein